MSGLTVVECLFKKMDLNLEIYQ